MATRLIGTDTANPRLPVDVIEATQGATHADLAPGDVGDTMQAYTDDKVAAALADANGYTDAAEADANAYTDAQIAAAVIDPAAIAFADDAETIAGTRDDIAVTPAGGAAAYTRLSDLHGVDPPPAAPGKGRNLIVGPNGAIAADVGTATILGGGSVGYENVIGGDTAHVSNPDSNLPTVTGTGADWSTIVGGYDNVVNGDACQVQGYHCKVETAASHGTISGGSLHNYISGDYSTIGGGTQHSIGAHQATISGGSINTITNAAATRATISGGGGNTVAGYGGTVAGGENNSATGTGAVIAGGTGNQTSNNYTSVGGGQNQVVSGQFGTVAGGTTNQATQTNATVGGGASNQATGNSATVTGGLTNVAGPGTAATVVGGRDNVASVGVATAMGREANAFLEGMFAQSSGKFAAVGDAQTAVCLLRNQTTNATQTELFLNGASGRLVLAADSTWAFNILVAARNTLTNGESAAYQFEGCIDRESGGTTGLVGTVTPTVLGEDVAAWDCVVDADTTNAALRIRVTGEASKTIRWVARATLVMVGG